MEKAAFYVRLSKEDENKSKLSDKSESIQNQILLLSDYASKHEMEIEGIYIDDDYSGLYEDRPEFKRLIQNATAGKFNTILCKTQSRFTRNVYLNEKYLEEIFPQLGIRFIGVVDGVDTNVYENKKSRQINGLINDWYVEDLSNNIRAVFYRKMKDGQNLASFPTFGYIKDPKDKHKLIIDETAAEIVKYIFDLALQGFGVNRIAQQLTQEKIPTPVQYKKAQGMNFSSPNNKYTKYGIWSCTTIKKILNNECYIGWLIQGRERKANYKSKKIITMPKDNWIIVKNHHDPIITEELYYAVQNLIKIRRRSCKADSEKKPEPHIFAGKIYCQQCHNRMVKTTGSKAKGYDYFQCPLAKKTKSQECTRHSIRFDQLEQCITEEIQKLINICLQDKQERENLVQELSKHNFIYQKLEKQNKLLDRNKQEIEINNLALSNLYVDKTKGVISEQEYLDLKIIFNKKNIELNNEILIIIKNINELQEDLLQFDNISDMVDKLSHIEKLTYEIVNYFISYIEIGEKDKAIELNQSFEKQDIIIHWNF